MKTFKYMAAVGASALMLSGVVAGSATAQPYRYYDNDRYSYSHSNLNTSYVDSLEWRINNAYQEGLMPNGQRRELLSLLRSIQPLAWRAQTGQASRWELNRLQNGVARIEAATTRYARNGRYPRYGYNDRRW
jgi:hypothetical protein